MTMHTASKAFLPALLLGVSGCATTPPPEAPAQISSAATAVGAAGFTSEDATFSRPYIDVQEWRSEPVRHYYVHGGFEGTETRFSFYLPPRDEYEGRFFQHITPVPDNENLAQAMPPGKFDKIGFSAASGGYFVETNGGGPLDIAGGAPQEDPTIRAYRANAAAAQFSRHVAKQFYDTEARPFGYAYGGSGGAYRTIGSMENTSGVWDGAVPYVPGSTMAIPNMFTLRVQAMRVLNDKFPQIIDAVEPGGSGDPYAGLTDREAEVLREADLMGFPLQSWFGYRTMGIHGLAALYPGVKSADPTYFTDFWTKPGYLGYDHPEYFEGSRMQFSARVAEPITRAKALELGLVERLAGSARGGVDRAYELANTPAGQEIVGYRLAETPPEMLFIAGDVVVESGASAGKTMPASAIHGDIVMLGHANRQVAGSVAAGDTIRIDNSDMLALESYHRHQVPGPDFPVWDQFRDAEGKPLYPQRPMLLGPIFTQGASGSRMTGEFDGKMILLASLWDREALPWQADWYRRRVEAAGNDVRLYYVDNALHGDEPQNPDADRIVSYQGPLQQALRAVAAWAENGIEPPQNTAYRIEDGQVIVPDNAAQRLGLQPVVSLTASGGKRAEVRVGQPVTLTGLVTVPPQGGSIVSAGWDFEGDGEYVPAQAMTPTAEGTIVQTSHRFAAPGTYFVTLRATAQPSEAQGTPYSELTDLDRVRIVVTQ